MRPPLLHPVYRAQKEALQDIFRSKVRKPAQVKIFQKAKDEVEDD